MLDKDDITNVCGTITPKEVCKELGITSNQFNNFVSMGKVFRDKYILIEDEKPKPKKELYSLMILETDAGRKYFARNDGVIYVVYKNGKVKILTGTPKDHRGTISIVVKLGNKNYQAKNLMAKLFIKEYKDGDVVLLRDRNIRNYAVDNLIVIDKGLYAKRTGAMSRSQPVGLFENGKMIRKWSSARKAAKSLYCSYQMVMNYCNEKVKDKEFDVRWI
jgi:hypothetical protein